MQANYVILRPVVTEKSTDQQAQGRYSFIIRKEATKVDVKLAIKELYGVEIEDVSIQYIKPKTRLVGRGRTFTKRPALKRAIVQTKGRKPLDINKFEFKK